MKYDLDKIREECLKLMGYSELLENEPVEGFPNPTASLDDALPLMEKFDIGVMRLRLAGGLEDPEPWSAWPTMWMEPIRPSIRAETAPLAVCLAALRCAGHDLAQYEVTT